MNEKEIMSVLEYIVSKSGGRATITKDPIDLIFHLRVAIYSYTVNFDGISIGRLSFTYNEGEPPKKEELQKAVSIVAALYDACQEDNINLALNEKQLRLLSNSRMGAGKSAKFKA